MTYNINIDGVDRPMTEEEQATFEQTQQEMLADAKKLQAEQKAAAKAKQLVLDKLGLTADEVSALLS